MMIGPWLFLLLAAVVVMFDPLVVTGARPGQPGRRAGAARPRPAARTAAEPRPSAAPHRPAQTTARRRRTGPPRGR